MISLQYRTIKKYFDDIGAGFWFVVEKSPSMPGCQCVKAPDGLCKKVGIFRKGQLTVRIRAINHMELVYIDEEGTRIEVENRRLPSFLPITKEFPHPSVRS